VGVSVSASWNADLTRDTGRSIIGPSSEHVSVGVASDKP